MLAAVLVSLLLSVSDPRPIADDPSDHFVASRQDAPSRPKRVKFDRIAMRLQPGQIYARAKVGMLCLPSETLVWQNGQKIGEPEFFAQTFHERMSARGMPVSGDPTDLFGSASDEADILIGGAIEAMSLDVCLPRSGFGDTQAAKGKASMSVEWQLYSRKEGRVIQRLRTTANYSQAKTVNAGMVKIMLASFAANVEQLADDPGFRASLVAAR